MKATLITPFLILGFLTACNDNISEGTHIAHQQSLIDSNAKICILGDPGTGDSAQYAVAKALEKVGCTQVRILGDLIYPSGLTSVDDPLLQTNFYTPYKKTLEKAPFYLVQGNHDYKQKFFNVWLDIARQDERIVYPAHYYSEQWDDICFISLETTFYEKLYHAFKRRPQTEWVNSAFTSMESSCDFSVVLAHHPFKSSGRHGPAVPQLAWFLSSEIIGRVDLYIAGHDHSVSDEGYADGTRMLISGSAGRTSTPEKDSEDKRFLSEKHGFIVLNFSRNKEQRIIANYEIHTVDVKNDEPISVIEWQESISGSGLRL